MYVAPAAHRATPAPRASDTHERPRRPPRSKAAPTAPAASTAPLGFASTSNPVSIPTSVGRMNRQDARTPRGRRRKEHIRILCSGFLASWRLGGSSPPGFAHARYAATARPPNSSVKARSFSGTSVPAKNGTLTARNPAASNPTRRPHRHAPTAATNASSPAMIATFGSFAAAVETPNTRNAAAISHGCRGGQVSAGWVMLRGYAL